MGRILQSHLDGELDAQSRRKVAEHLEECLRCGMDADLYNQIKFALALDQLSKELQQADDSAAVIERLRLFAISLTQSDEPGDT